MKPPGVLPRHVQMWVMVIIALVILAIILLTGHPQPLPRPQAGARSAQPTLVPPDRVRSYEQQLAADLAREQQGLAPSSAPAGRATRPAGPVATSSADATAEDQRRRDYQSLFADNIALSRRAADRQPYGERRQDSAFTSSSSPSTALPRRRPARTAPREERRQPVASVDHECTGSHAPGRAASRAVIE